MIENGGNPGHFNQDRQDAERELEQGAKEEARLDPHAPGNFITLKNLRNALSHGSRAKVDAQSFAAQ